MQLRLSQDSRYISVAWFETEQNEDEDKNRKMIGGAVIKAYDSHSLKEIEISNGLKESLENLPDGILNEIVFVNKCRHLLVKILINEGKKVDYSHFLVFDVQTGKKVYEINNKDDLGEFKILSLLVKPEEPYKAVDDTSDSGLETDIDVDENETYMNDSCNEKEHEDKDK